MQQYLFKAKKHLECAIAHYKVSVVLFSFFFVSCNTSYEEPIISLDSYQIESGFEVSVLASEPLLKAPVAIDFDSKGRIWVVQMPGYMNDMQGTNEEKPIGSIKILEDLDNDGVADHAKTFLDNLVMPRALAHVYGGLLYAEPPFLYFVEIEDDKPLNRIIVDSVYAAVGNPEHQPNGLHLNIDNWIYNAKSNFRYQKKDGVWLKEATTFRGQWGISHDNFGRLYYNNNSQQLLGDHVLPNRLIRNTHFTPKKGVSQMLTKDQRVYPLKATAVNRGYASGVLNADSILVNTTAAAGLVVYRGGVFSEEYDQNVFVSMPEVNLIKRNILTFMGDSTVAKQAWENKEFLTSTDEGFRPVSLYNGPDGSLYIVDMHRGVIGHHAYLSPYFKEKTKENRLDTLTDYGRILKVNRKGATLGVAPKFDELTDHEFVNLLKHKNGWIRNRAQHQLIFKGKKEVIPDLKELALNAENQWTRIHALHTLNGLEALDFSFLRAVVDSNFPDVTAHAIVLIEQYASKENSDQAVLLFKNLIAKNNPIIDLYLGSTLGTWLSIEQEPFFQDMMVLLKRKKDNPIFTEALVGGMQGIEAMVLEDLKNTDTKETTALISKLTEILENKKEKIRNPIFTRESLDEDNRTAGAKMYFQICASCHGTNGGGIDGLAPPLQGSEYVADSEQLALIILHGLQGPITVKGKRYDLNLAMPGLIRNETISDKDIADVIAYVTNAFSDEPNWFKKERVTELRALKPKSDAEYTEQELLEHSKQ